MDWDKIEQLAKEGFTQTETAAQLGLSAATFRSRLYKEGMSYESFKSHPKLKDCSDFQDQSINSTNILYMPWVGDKLFSKFIKSKPKEMVTIPETFPDLSPREISSLYMFTKLKIHWECEESRNNVRSVKFDKKELVKTKRWWNRINGK